MRDFLKTTLATLVGLLIFSGVSLGGLLFLIMGLASSRSTGPQVKDKTVLVMDLAQPITDSQPERSPQEVVNDTVAGNLQSTVTLRTVLTTIDQAAKDDRILALYLTARDSSSRNGSGYATLKEVREALQRFKASGKKIYAYDVEWGEKEYYLASVADNIAVNPMGVVEMNGLSSQTMFFSQALQKFGVGVQAIWRGKYKSAVEPFLRQRSSNPSKEQTTKLLNDIWGEFLTATGKARNLDPNVLQKLSDTKGILTAADAKQAKLVDRVVYADEVLDELKKLTGEEDETKSFRGISLRNYAEAISDRVEKVSENQIAVVYAEGEIVNGSGDVGQIGGDSFARTLRRLRQDKDVKAVVLRINSPGGSATASDIIQREVIVTRKVKPVIVSMGSVAASGGYWIATYGDRIFAEPTTITGSIGVFGLLPNIQKLANDNGITWDVVKTGKFADGATISRPKTQEEITIVQRIIGQIYDQFLTKVAESRKLDKAKVAEIAQGRVWSGAEAKKIGLVDELGGLEAAIKEAANRAKLGDNWQVEEYPEPTSFEERVLRSLFGAQIEAQPQGNDPFTEEFKKLQTEFNTLRSLNDPRGIYLRMPENLRIE
ncbi:signal peptide peptidase SppA [Alkalinema sp. FACHB-956]|uniref:signal peptide peptidase SppA n=1 Tax=Alkalinema sp. FACHB-956 TaxID=2692768 RepID=UPI001686126B|nr:signal peptide peptidase SppA [Alkalinema sp. FACHB-956]MBD2325631.1 signal peptide peptidase SppA [Alkalinema sp. FACHB-956]